MAGIRKISRILGECLEYRFFLLLFLAMDFMFGFLLWLMDERGFYVLAGVFAVSSLGLFGMAIGFIVRREARRRRIVEEYLENLEKRQASSLLSGLPPREREQMLQIGRKLQEDAASLRTEQLLREAYEEYVEAWVHEIKVPLSLMALLVDNRRDEMSPLLYRRLVYAGGQISEYVTQMLYYARLKSSHRDIRFERVSLQECCKEILEKYETILAEEQIKVVMEVEDVCVVTDRKGILFILEQAVSNACKYQDNSKQEKWLEFSGGLEAGGDKICLSIRDNGIGAKQADIPFLFDRGFTGDTDERKRKATGMGLYLAKQMAYQLNIELIAEAEYGRGFVLALHFPVVDAFGHCGQEETVDLRTKKAQ